MVEHCGGSGAKRGRAGQGGGQCLGVVDSGDSSDSAGVLLSGLADDDSGFFNTGTFDSGLAIASNLSSGGFHTGTGQSGFFGF